MRFLGFTKALIAWILFFGNGCLSNLQMSERPQTYSIGSTNVQANESQMDETYDDNVDIYQKKTPSITCNCSWGTVQHDQLENKIIGGNTLSKDENYPMMVGIQDTMTRCTFCGGSILTEYHVLTAAHCVFNEDISMMRLSVGVKHRCRRRYNTGQIIPLDNVYVHEDYDPESNHNDIAIILAKRKIIFSNNVGPTCIHSEPFSDFDAPILVMGWGNKNEYSRPSNVLMKVFLKYVDTETCESKLPEGYIDKNLNLQLCTYADNKDACSGDSGGPLFFVDTSVNRLTQIALVSMGYGCARNDTPAVNTALYPYLAWMKRIISKSLRKHLPKGIHDGRHALCEIKSSNIGSHT